MLLQIRAVCGNRDTAIANPILNCAFIQESLTFVVRIEGLQLWG